MLSIETIIYALRPKTLIAAISPVLISFSLLLYWDVTLNLKILLLLFNILFAAALIQIISNVANDLFDYLKGADTEERKGPKRILQSGLASPKQIQTLLCICIVLAVLSGIPLVLYGGLPILIVGVVCILIAIFYTAGPYPLAYLGLGEIFVLIIFGPLATSCTHYLLQSVWYVEAFFVGLAPGLFSVALLEINNIRDIDEDCKVSKKTLAVRFGKAFAEKLFQASLLLPCLITLIFALHAKVLLSLLSLLYVFAYYSMSFNKIACSENIAGFFSKTCILHWIYLGLFVLGGVLSHII